MTDFYSYLAADPSSIRTAILSERVHLSFRARHNASKLFNDPIVVLLKKFDREYDIDTLDDCTDNAAGIYLTAKKEFYQVLSKLPDTSLRLCAATTSTQTPETVRTLLRDPAREIRRHIAANEDAAALLSVDEMIECASGDAGIKIQFLKTLSEVARNATDREEASNRCTVLSQVIEAFKNFGHTYSEVNLQSALKEAEETLESVEAREFETAEKGSGETPNITYDEDSNIYWARGDYAYVLVAVEEIEGHPEKEPVVKAIGPAVFIPADALCMVSLGAAP